MKLTPFQILLIGFIGMIGIGAILLTLPIASSQNTHQSFIDALFTATSAVTTTGLVVVDTGTYYSLFGQLVILTLIQVAALGYTVFIALIVLGLGGRLSFNGRMLLRDSMNRPTSIDIIKFAKLVILFTLSFELIGAAVLSFLWTRHTAMPEAIYKGIFHSISAFCTAGFSLFSNSFTSYGGGITFNIVVAIICITGGIGFFVLYDIYTLGKKTLRHEVPRRLSVHTKFVLLLTIVLITLGAIVIFFAEGKALSPLPGKRFLSAVFQSMTASTTAGFNTVPIGTMAATSLFAIIFLMFVGASPGGTGAGIKTTSFGIMLLFLFSFLKGREDINLFKRRIPPANIRSVFAITLSAIFWIMIAILVLTVTEKAAFLNILFEVVSALGNVGLSTGITSTLSSAGKIVISIVMLVGRMGPLAIGFSLIGKPRPVAFRYAETDILVG